MIKKEKKLLPVVIIKKRESEFTRSIEQSPGGNQGYDEQRRPQIHFFLVAHCFCTINSSQHKLITRANASQEKQQKSRTICHRKLVKNWLSDPDRKQLAWFQQTQFLAWSRLPRGKDHNERTLLSLEFVKTLISKPNDKRIYLTPAENVEHRRRLQYLSALTRINLSKIMRAVESHGLDDSMARVAYT